MTDIGSGTNEEEALNTALEEATPLLAESLQRAERDHRRKRRLLIGGLVMLVLGASIVASIVITADEPGIPEDPGELGDTKAVVQTEEPQAHIEQLKSLLESELELDELRKKGRSLKHRHRYNEAAIHFIDAIKLYPDSAQLWSDLGWTFVPDKQYDEAENAFRQALSLDENSFDAINGMGWIAYRKLDLEEAKRWFQKHPRLQSSVVHTDLLLGEFEQAAERAEKLIAQFPEDSDEHPDLPSRAFLTELHEAAVAKKIPDDLRKKIEPEGWVDHRMMQSQAFSEAITENLLDNGGFEHSTNGWIIGSNSNRMKLTPDKDIKTEGKQSLKITKTGGLPIDIVRVNFDDLTPGRKVNVSAKIKSEKADNAWMKFYVWDAEGNVLIENLDVAHIHGTFDWRTAKKRFTIPENASNAAIQFWIVMGAKIWIDDVRIEPVKTQTDDAVETAAPSVE